jgi:hypothetical protein
MAATPKRPGPPKGIEPKPSKTKNPFEGKVTNPKGEGPMRVTVKISPNDQAQMEKALKDLMAKRMKEVKKTGVYPNYNTN